MLRGVFACAGAQPRYPSSALTRSFSFKVVDRRKTKYVDVVPVAARERPKQHAHVEWTRQFRIEALKP
jgi:hypothetical protein